MIKKLLTTAAIFTAVGSAGAVAIVDGVANGDIDGASPFETLQAAVEFVNSGSETVIEIQTNELPGGLYFADTPLNHDLTIQAGVGFTPVIKDAVHFLPTNEVNLVTLKDITISTNLGLPVDAPTTGALHVGCNLTAVNCIFNSNWETLAKNFAVSCAVPSAGTVSTLTMTSCTLKGHSGLETGRAAQEHILDGCLIDVYQPTGDSFPALGITNARNFRSGLKLTSGTGTSKQRLDARMDGAAGFFTIGQPRNVTLKDTIVRAGTVIGWPTSKEDGLYNVNENNVFGRINAVNCVFDTVRNPEKQAWPSAFGAGNLPATQDINCAFTHCTFRATSPEETTVTAQMKAANGLVYFPTNTVGTPIVNFTNCLFDAPSVDYLMFDVNSHTDLSGDGNTYHYLKNSTHHRGVISGGGSYPARAEFELTQRTDITELTLSSPTFVDSDGNIVTIDPRIVANAVPTVPVVTTDIHGESRPMPISALKSDIGADEIDETLPASVNDWSVY